MKMKIIITLLLVFTSSVAMAQRTAEEKRQENITLLVAAMSVAIWSTVVLYKNPKNANNPKKTKTSSFQLEPSDSQKNKFVIAPYADGKKAGMVFQANIHK